MSLSLPHIQERTLASGVHLGFAWQIAKNAWGYRCGYICVGPDHPWYAIPYGDIDAAVHGGLTYAERGTAGMHDDPAEWWIGFDCAHAFDAADPDLMDDRSLADHLRTQAALQRFRLPDAVRETIKDTAYVESMCRALCRQAREAADGEGSQPRA
jgi:hypothetical protein